MLRVHYQAHDRIAGSIGLAHVQWSSLVTMAAPKVDMPAPPPFKVIGENINLAKSWELYLKRFDYYLNASGVTKDEQKKAMVLHLAGEEIQDIFVTLGNINECNFGQVKTK